MKQLYKAVVYGCAFLWFAAKVSGAAVQVPVATDLQRDGAHALEQHLPILLAFSADECSYCEMLEEDFLEPMLLSGDYRDKIIIRKLILDNGSSVIDFNGKAIDATRLSNHYRVFVTPTILFVDANGKELAERMVGINTPELYGGYLDVCIETALLGIRNPDRLADLTGCRLQLTTP